MVETKPNETALAELRSLEAPRSLVDKAAGKSSVHWLEIGDRWVETMETWGGLRPGHRVLDVGCGVGRMAIALASALDEHGSYEGFDVQKRAIKWCKQEIEPRWPRSRFQVVNVRSSTYRRLGREDASSFRFPFEDEEFDFVFMTSVFTHMLRDEIENYLRETRRVLAPDGRCLITYYVLNDEVRSAIADGRARYSFAHEVAPGCYVARRHSLRSAVAYDEAVLRQLYADAGLALVEPVRYGSWSGAYPDARHGQDTIVAASL